MKKKYAFGKWLYGKNLNDPDHYYIGWKEIQSHEIKELKEKGYLIKSC